MSPVVFVTGSSRGIGLGLCQELLTRGYTVFTTARHPHTEAIEDMQKQHYLVRTSGISSQRYLGKLDGDPVFQVAEGFLKMKDAQSFETIEGPNILAFENYVLKMGDAFMFSFGVPNWEPVLLKPSLPLKTFKPRRRQPV